uniref:DNA polymerase III subunit gamma/tau n=1 Tax=Anthurium amnicola TaxID=1678845 RepID=A0A1D1XWY9_9ARAE
MTRPVHSDFLKEENGTISDHLRNHLHLTNCIHVKNHIHRLSPVMAERSLIRDLIMLQRSRSLRDPSASPPSWHSPSVASCLARKLDKDGMLHGGKPFGIERRKEGGRLSVSSPRIPSMATSKVAAAEASSDNNSLGRCKDSGMSRAESSRKNRRSNLSGINGKSPTLLVSRKTDIGENRVWQKGTRKEDIHLKTLSERLAGTTNQTDSEDLKSSHIHHRTTDTGQERNLEELEADAHIQCNVLDRPKRRNFKTARRGQGSICSRDLGAHKDLSVASNSLAQGSMHQKYYARGAEADADLNVTQGPRNGCGIPWNWSRIHHRSKTFLDMAGRSLSCGRTEPRLRRTEDALFPQTQTDATDVPVASDHLSSSTRSDSEALPLLVEPSGSANPFLAHDYSGELGIYANHNLNHDQNSEFASEARSGNHHNLNGRHHSRHQSLTQKYMPKTFRDLVGQNLVVQALSNAVVRRKVGLVYVFYGPHGIGKTSCARIFARALNCQALEHPKPCSTCTSCISLNLGNSQSIVEVGPIGNVDFEGIIDLLEKMMLRTSSSQYRVFIVDDCDTLSPDSWNAISKVIDRAPRHVVFLLISTNLDSLPHMIISRCQKFFFPKLKDADIIYALQWIATKEGLEIDKDALKLVASRSDGSLRDAEMTLDQLSLLSQSISLTLVQELVGLVSDEKLVDLLDLALSADTVNTVKRLREIMEAGVEPLALMSQLATIITDILAGSYVFTREKLRKKFFRRQMLSKEDMEKLRQALKTLSEAEKQLRLSNDKWTWLTAALLQLAPDQQYMLPISSAETSFNHSPMLLNNISERDLPRKSTCGYDEVNNGDRGISRITGAETSSRVANGGMRDDFKMKNGSGRRHVGVNPSQASVFSAELTETGGPNRAKRQNDIQKIWLAVLEKIQVNSLKQFMLQEGKLISVSFGAAPTVQLMFSSHVNKSKAEKFRGHILQAFESILSSAITLEIRCESCKDAQPDNQGTCILRASENGSSQMKMKRESISNDMNLRAGSENHRAKILKDHTAKGIDSDQIGWMHSDSVEMAKSEIVEVANSPRRLADVTDQHAGNGIESVRSAEPSTHNPAALVPLHERRGNAESSRRQSLVRSKVSLAHVIQQAEGCTQRSGWSRRKAISIAEKLEQENLRLEPRSRSLLCCNASKITHRKVLHLRIRPRKPLSFLKRVSCGRCLQTNSPR